MPGPEITLACQDYDQTRALRDGAVTAAGFELKLVSISPPSQIFLRMLHDEEFDASEMSLSNYMIACGQGDTRFVAIPVLPSRMFRHSYIWINANAGIREPRDLIGKRVGIADYSMTALLFIRGMLQHQHNVLPADIHWFRRRSEHLSIKTPADIRVDNIEKDQTLDDLLEAGNLDAVAVTSAPRGFRRGSPVIRRLFSNARDAEAEYYRQTKIFPIMHVVVIRRAVYDRYPQLAAGKRTDARLQVVHQMLNPAGSWDGAGDRRVRDHKLEKELRPTRATDFRSPAGQRFSAHLAEQIGLREWPVHQHCYVPLGRQRQ